MGRGSGVQGGGSIPTGCRPGVEETSTVVSQEEKGASRRPVLPKVPAGWGSVAEQRREGFSHKQTSGHAEFCHVGGEAREWPQMASHLSQRPGS